MGQQINAKHWVIREQIVADPVSGLTLEFSVTEDGTPCLSLYGDCLVFGNRTIVFENDGETIHGETVIPHEIHCCGHQADVSDDHPQESYRSRIGSPR
jgi:hypothetical protein